MYKDCILCGHNFFLKLFNVREAVFSQSIRSYDVIQCTNCKLSRMDPFPSKEEIEELYTKENIFSNPMENPFKKKWFYQCFENLYAKYGAGDLKWEAKKTLSYLKHASNSVSLLDIGCNDGRFLEHLSARKNIDCYGIDLDSNFYRLQNKKIHYVNGDFLEYDFGQKFDVVTMRYLLEHLPEFTQCIEKARSILNDEGVLYIAVPDIGSLKACALKGEWNMVNDRNKKIGHVSWLTRQTFKYISEKYALMILEMRNRGELIHHLPSSIQQGIKSIFGVEPLTQRPISNYQLRIIYSIIFDNIVPRYFDYGDCVQVWLKKQ